MENNELKKVCINNHACFYFDDIIKKHYLALKYMTLFRTKLDILDILS